VDFNTDAQSGNRGLTIYRGFFSSTSDFHPQQPSFDLNWIDSNVYRESDNSSTHEKSSLVYPLSAKEKFGGYGPKKV
jgi:hypothetical protein